MVTNEKRRRVAATLRKFGARKHPNFNYAYLYAAMGLDPVEALEAKDLDAELYNRLADLIEPSEEHSDDAGKTVDVDALLELAEEAERCAWYFGLDFYEDEMAERLTEAEVDFSSIAAAIREACGRGERR